MKIALKKYKGHMYQSKVRGIDFQLTFDEWYNWWLSNGIDKNLSIKWIGANRLCMCRYKDIGPYSLNNIYCATNSQNVKDFYLQGAIPRKPRKDHNVLYRWGTTLLSEKELMETYGITKNRTIYYHVNHYDFNNKEMTKSLTKKWNKNQSSISLEDYIKQHSRYPDPYMSLEENFIQTS